MITLRRAAPALAALTLASCAVSTKTVVVDLDRQPQTAASTPSTDRADADRKTAVEGVVARGDVPDDLRKSLRAVAEAASALETKLSSDADRQRQDFLAFCKAVGEEALPPLTPAERRWLDSQRTVPSSSPAVDCVFYRYRFASALFFKRGGADYYVKYEVLPLAGRQRRVVRNPVAYAGETEQEVELTEPYHNLVRARREFSYCIEGSDGCRPRTVRHRATIVFTRNQQQVETLHLLDELVTRDGFGSGATLRRVALYSETAQEHLTSITVGEDPSAVAQAMGYAMPNEIIYVREGRELLRLDEAALAAVRRVMDDLPSRF